MSATTQRFTHMLAWSSRSRTSHYNTSISKDWWKSIQGYPYTATMFPSLIASYDAIFVDEAEDLGSYVLDQATGLDIQTEKFGHFWILFDHLQESTSNAGVTIMGWDPSMGSSKRCKSKGTIKMTNINRSSVKCTNFLRHSRLIAM